MNLLTHVIEPSLLLHKNKNKTGVKMCYYNLINDTIIQYFYQICFLDYIYLRQVQYNK